MAEILSTLSSDGLAGTPVNGGAGYVLMSTWESAQQGNLTTNDNTAGEPSTSVLECYAYDLEDNLLLDGWTMDATHGATIRAAAGNGHNGVPRNFGGTGFRMYWGASGFAEVINVQSNMVLTVEDIQLERTEANSYDILRCNATGSNLTARNIICTDTTTTVTGDYMVNAGAVGAVSLFQNCLILDLSTLGNWGMGCGNDLDVTLDSCTFIANGSRGVYDNGDTLIRNTVCVAGSTSYESATPAIGSTNNGASDAKELGPNPQTGIVLTDGVDFVSPSTGDYSPQPGGKLDGTGFDASADYTTDIAGDTRTVPWTIGAYAIPSTGPGISFDGPNVDTVDGTDGTPLPDPTPNPSMDSRFTVTGGTATYALSPTSGALPTGVTIDSATGNLVGTPSVEGTFPGVIVRGTV